MERESLAQILERRKEIGEELTALLEETESNFSLQDIRDAIFHEQDTDDMMKIVAMFDRGGDASELSNVLELVSDAWNYFPHKALSGISPAEMAFQTADALSNLPPGAFLPFFKVFPRNAETETRKIILPQDTFGLPKGIYFLAENYCADKECDCRKVMINVVTMDDNPTVLGTVGFGWEDAEYYKKWLNDDQLGEEMASASIEVGGIQAGMEKECLDLVKNSLRDKNYVNLIKKRYKTFKEKMKSEHGHSLV